MLFSYYYLNILIQGSRWELLLFDADLLTATFLNSERFIVFIVAQPSSQANVFWFLGLFLFFSFTPMAYGGSQAGGPIGATAAGLPHSCSNAGSEPHL